MSAADPKITSVYVDPEELTKGKSEVKITANATDDVGVTEAYSFVAKPDASDISDVITYADLTLTGDARNGKWTGTLIIPSSTSEAPIPDGKYLVYVVARDVDGYEGYNFPDIVTYLKLSRGDTSGDVVAPFINTVTLNPPEFTKGISEVSISAKVTDDVGVNKVWARLFESGTSAPISGSGSELSLTEGSPQDGTWNGVLTIPLDVSDGNYQVVSYATDVAGNSAESNVLDLKLSRGETQNSDDAKKGPSSECQCNVTINITAGPVNIYVCPPESTAKPIS
jgi:hypothetical protein